MAVDDHARIAFTGMPPNERQESAVQFLHDAVAYYAALGVRIKHVLSGAGMAFEFADGEHFALTLGSPRLRFSGERGLENRLLDRSTSDFNLMWVPARYQADLWLRTLAGASTLFAEPGETWVLQRY